jgi:NTP pyrophosphatase (non-canonical NTP hydrolase)
MGIARFEEAVRPGIDKILSGPDDANAMRDAIINHVYGNLDEGPETLLDQDVGDVALITLDGNKVTVDDYCNHCLKEWSDDELLDGITEELAELIVAINHYKRGRKSEGTATRRQRERVREDALAKLAEEVADVETSIMFLGSVIERRSGVEAREHFGTMMMDFILEKVERTMREGRSRDAA